LGILCHSQSKQQHNDTEDMGHVPSEAKDVHAHRENGTSKQRALGDVWTLSKI
jgi:hypothetical protein